MPPDRGADLQWPSSVDADSATAGQEPTALPDIERLRADLLRAVRKVCGRPLADDAEDLAHIALSRVMDRLRDTRGTIELSRGYLYRAAYSVVIDEIRRRRRRPEAPIDPEVSVAARVADPERQAIGLETRVAVRQCLEGLAVFRRRAVTLHLLGSSIAEISRLLECGRKQTENYLYRGLADLRACLRARQVTP
jgi:RNA polymerase sigma-70 factor (ECF subfamily)